MPKPKVFAKLPLSSPLEQLDDLLRRNVIIKYQISVPRTFLPIIGYFQRLLLQTFAKKFKSDETYIFRNTMQSGKSREKKLQHKSCAQTLLVTHIDQRKIC